MTAINRAANLSVCMELGFLYSLVRMELGFLYRIIVCMELGFLYSLIVCMELGFLYSLIRSRCRCFPIRYRQRTSSRHGPSPRSVLCYIMLITTLAPGHVRSLDTPVELKWNQSYLTSAAVSVLLNIDLDHRLDFTEC